MCILLMIGAIIAAVIVISIVAWLAYIPMHDKQKVDRDLITQRNSINYDIHFVTFLASRFCW